ncbi:HAD-IC family P-type ATPase [Streptomyces rubrisoli]|uniref:Magnesium-transporting ATPase, P-type 1 n=1 Tax=Streptantibioticus rubrisoli TaxID=1387313 RepID=A0ABT1PIM4_9ACTN|nr:HAD-IC family P-type ATPase [Streptantibioticus rubrisoli]MCQ4045214.1 HAD-IC family P-type ATPase [Streptantibioticus rubrisoli]
MLTGVVGAGLTSLEVLRRLDAGPRGLVEDEATRRLQRYGENAVLPRRPAAWAWRLLGTLRDPFTAVLLGLGVVSAFATSWSTACVIAVLVAVSCVLRSAGEYRADRSVAALRDLVATTATVQRRADEESAPLVREIPVEELVPGDVVRLGPGDMVPADVRLLRADGLTVHQAALTGESAPVAKRVPDTPVELARPLFDQPHLCFAGSSVTAGTATAVVTATGADTHFASAHRGPTGRRRGAFDRSVNGISWTLIRFMTLTAPLVLLANTVLRGRGLETLPFAVAVAVGLTPEMLPVIVTTALARGAAQLARRVGVIVKRLPALHDMGAVDVLCVDKTGTLTQDQLTVDCYLDTDGHTDPAVLHWAAVNSLWTIQLADVPAPDALDEAILAAAKAAGGPAADRDDLLCRTPPPPARPERALSAVHEPAAARATLMDVGGVDVIPFDPARRVVTAVVQRPGRPAVHTLVVKGAVEDVLDRCAIDEETRARVLRLAGRHAARGLRLLAVALADRPARARPYTPADERGLTLLGIVGLRDELTATAADALAALARRGVAVKVLTGDHPGTAARVCAELGLTPGEIVTGDRIDALDDARLAQLADTTTVFARCTPAHKARVVRALRRGGHAVGFLGDGVNDVAAMHAADVALCPHAAVDVTREAADVVLAEKDLTAIDSAVAAGRHSTGNIATYLRIAVSSNVGNVISMLAAGVLLPFLPMLPAQVLAQNLCFDISQLAFAYDRPDAASVRRPSVLRPYAFSRYITVFGLVNAAADLATFAVLGVFTRGQTAFHSGWFTENLITQALVMLLLRTARGPLPGALRWATGALAAVGLLLPLSPLGAALGLAALPMAYYGCLVMVLVAYGLALAACRKFGWPVG